MPLPTDPKERKTYPVYSGVISYFPDALIEVAHVSYIGNEQHNPGQPLHWNRSKSQDEKDAEVRHLLDPLTIGGSKFDTDGVRHAAKKAWRALADLQKEIESEKLEVSPTREMEWINTKTGERGTVKVQL